MNYPLNFINISIIRRRSNLSYRRWRSRCIGHACKSQSLKRIGETVDGLGVVSMKHSRLGIGHHNIWVTAPRKFGVISPPWIVIRGK